MPSHNVLSDIFEASYTRQIQLADPGDAGTIKATASPQYVGLVSAGAETRTLADPDGPGQQLTIGFESDSGDVTITASSAVNQAGSTSLVFSDIGEFITFVSVVDDNSTSPDSFEWRIVAKDGVAVTDDADDFTDLTVTNLVVDGIFRNTGVQAADQPTPTAKTTAVTLTIAELLTKIITATHSEGGTEAYTLPTGTLTDAGLPDDFAVDDSFDWYLINLSAALADTITVTADTGHTIVGEAVVESAHADSEFQSSAHFRTRKTAANTFVTYRLS